MKEWEAKLNKNIDEYDLENGLNNLNLIESSRDIHFNSVSLVEGSKDRHFDNFCKSKSRLIQPKIVFKFNKDCVIRSGISDAVSEAYFRIEISRNDNPQKILQKYASTQLEFTIGGQTINKAPLKVFYYLCEKFGRSIEIINPAIMCEKNTPDKITKNYVQYNQRFNFEKVDVLYLDIPIIFEDFSYSHVDMLFTNGYHEFRYICDKKLDNECFIVYDKLINYFSNRRGKISLLPTEKLMTSLAYNPIQPSNNLNIKVAKYAKFFFLFMEKKKDSFIDFPEILSFSVVNNKKTIHYDTYNFLLEDYEHCRIYGVSFDPNITMKKWLKS